MCLKARLAAGIRELGTLGGTKYRASVAHASWAFVLFFALISTQVHAQPSQEAALARAEQSMRLGREVRSKVVEARQHFRDAAEACADLHRGGVVSPELYLLWGNAELLADRVPRAIWAYHSGLRLDPWNRILREHLALARSRVARAQSNRTAPQPDSWSVWLPAPWTSLVTASLALALSCAAAAAWHVTRSTQMGWFALAALALALVASAGCARATKREIREREQPRVVIAEPDTPMNLGNGPSYPPHPETPRLPAGAEGRLVHRRGGWLRIELAAGDVGWIPAAKALVVPSTW